RRSDEPVPAVDNVGRRHRAAVGRWTRVELVVGAQLGGQRQAVRRQLVGFDGVAFENLRLGATGELLLFEQPLVGVLLDAARAGATSGGEGVEVGLVGIDDVLVDAAPLRLGRRVGG